MGLSGTARTRLANPRCCVRAEPAVGGDERVEIKKELKMKRQNPPKNVKWWCSGTDFLEICENYMLRNGNSGLKMGVSRAAHTQYAYIMEVPPPPPRLISFINRKFNKNMSQWLGMQLLCVHTLSANSIPVFICTYRRWYIRRSGAHPILA